MLRMLLKLIRNKKNIINKVLQENGSLCPGRYALCNSLTYLYRKDTESRIRAHELFGRDHISPIVRIVLYILKICFFSKDIIVFNDNGDSHFQGTVCSLGVFRESGKIFDFTNNKVMTLFLSKDEYLSTLHNYFHFIRYFPKPELLWKDDDHFTMIESFVPSKPRSIWSEEDYAAVMNDVFIRYSQYFAEVNKQGYFSQPLAVMYENYKKDQMFKTAFADINQELLQMKFPYVRLHGDLWMPNILISESAGIYYIDYEFSDDLIFFYDIFWLITEKAFMSNQFEYVYKYLKGDYDQDLSSIFQILHLVYDTRFRLDYIRIFFLNYAGKRWSRLNWWKRRMNCKKYKKFIRNLVQLREGI